MINCFSQPEIHLQDKSQVKQKGCQVRWPERLSVKTSTLMTLTKPFVAGFAFASQGAVICKFEPTHQSVSAHCMYRLLFASDFWHVLGSRSYVSGLLVGTRAVALLGLSTYKRLHSVFGHSTLAISKKSQLQSQNHLTTRTKSNPRSVNHPRRRRFDVGFDAPQTIWRQRSEGH